MESWRQYQHDVADFYRALGFTAEVDVQGLPGARGTHDVDVLVQSKIGGQTTTWIVECKEWTRPVSKEHVLALQSIVADVGADRGILVSESGFQAGAYRVAVSTNLTLTSLSDLRENTQDERDAAALSMLTARAAQVSRRVSAIWPWAAPLVPEGPFSIDDVLEAATPSLELQMFIVPRLHLGEDVSALTILDKHKSAGGPLEATASLISEIEATLFALESKRDDRIIATETLLKALRTSIDAFITFGAEHAYEKDAPAMVAEMRHARAAVDQVLISAPESVATATRAVMNYLLHVVYLLPEKGTDADAWEEARTKAQALLRRAWTFLCAEASLPKSSPGQVG